MTFTWLGHARPGTKWGAAIGGMSRGSYRDNAMVNMSKNFIRLLAYKRCGHCGLVTNMGPAVVSCYERVSKDIMQHFHYVTAVPWQRFKVHRDHTG